MTTPWQRTNETIQYAGYRKIVRRTYRMPDGRSEDFEIFETLRVVTILAITPEQKVLLAKQFRPGPERVLLELPGGAVEPDETPEIAARRELLEETGCEGELHFVADSWSAAYSTMHHYNYVALNCRSVADPRLDANEFIELVELSLDEFRSLLRSGQLTDVATGYLGLDFLGLL